jgi:hypothetical protein
MAESTALTDAVDRLAGRLRSLPQRRLAAGAAARGLELARLLADRAQELESPGVTPREMPEEGVFAVGDQLAVAGHDLAAALVAADSEVAEEVTAQALEQVARTARAIG